MLSTLKAAVRVQQPPTLFGWRTGEGWTDLDRLLVKALQLYQEDLHKCGFPWWMCSSEEIIGRVQRDYTHCFICEKIDEADPKTEHVMPGDQLTIRNELFQLYAPKWLRKLTETQ